MLDHTPRPHAPHMDETKVPALSDLTAAEYRVITERVLRLEHVLSMHHAALDCALCGSPMDDPVTSLCGHSHCRQCYERLLTRDARTCAVCADPLPAQPGPLPSSHSLMVSGVVSSLPSSL